MDFTGIKNNKVITLLDTCSEKLELVEFLTHQVLALAPLQSAALRQSLMSDVKGSRKDSILMYLCMREESPIFRILRMIPLYVSTKMSAPQQTLRAPPCKILSLLLCGP